MLRGIGPRNFSHATGLAFGKEKTWLITHVEEVSGLFYCQLTDSSVAVKYERLFQDIEGTVSTGKIKSFEKLPTIGDVCLAKFSEDDQWYRAQVLNVNAEPDNEVEVFFIDFGNGETTAWSALKFIPEEFCELPAQAWQCRLANVEPVGGVWSKEAVAFLRELILDRELKGIPAHLCKMGTVVMRLFADEDVLVAQQLVMAGYAHWKKSRSSRSNSSASGSSSSTSSLSVKAKTEQFNEIKVKNDTFIDVCVSYTESPAMFFCQLTEYSDDLNAMFDEMQTFYNSNQATNLPMKSAYIGQLCVAKFFEDNSWYRGIITETSDNSKFKIHFVDYGNSEILHLNNVRALIPKFLQLPALSMKCCLYEVKSNAEGSPFSTECTAKFEEYTFEKQLVGHVKEISSNGQMKIILLDTADGKELNINNELVNHGLANSCHATDSQSLKTGKSNNSHDALQTSIQHKYVSLTIEVGTTELAYIIYSTDPFDFSCQFAKNVDSLENMMQELNDEYCKLKSGENKLQHFQVGMPCCAQYSDGRYYRAEIKEITTSKAKIYYIDYGNDEECNLSELKHLKKEYLKLPKQSFKCKLADVQPNSEGSFSPEAIAKFNDIVIDREFDLTVVNIDAENCCKVRLVEHNPKNVVTLDVSKTLMEAGLVDSENAYLSKGSFGPVMRSGDYKEIKVPENDYVDIVVTHVNSPSQFYCQLVSNADDIDSMMAALDEAYQTTKPLQKVAWKNGMPVVALYPTDGVWYRSVLINQVSQQAEVIYIDFGNSELIAMKDIRPMYEDFMKLPAQAFVCCLSDSRIKNDQQWTKSEIDAFSESVLEKHLIARLIKKDQSNIHHIELLDILSNHNQQLNMADVLFAKDHTGSTDKNNLSYQALEKPSVQPSLSISVKDKESVFVTFVESPSSFYLQLASNSQRIDDIMYELESNYAHLSPEESQIVSATCGQIVAAKFSEDGVWYRGRVDKIINDKTVEVKYIDYGNRESQSVTELKKLTAELSQDPDYALQCCLDGISPISGTWDKETINKFDVMVQEKTLTASFKTKQPPFTVSLLDDGKDLIAELLKTGSVVRNDDKTTTPKFQKYMNVELKVGSTEEIYVSHVDDLSNFYCQLKRQEDQLNKLMDDVAEKCGISPASNYSFGPSQPVCALYSEDGQWYRALVTNVKENKTIKVCFVDYGNSEIVSVADIRPVDESLMQEPAFAVSCSLGNDNAEWIENAVTLFSDKTRDIVLQMTVKEKVGDKFIVDLFSENGVSLTSDLKNATLTLKKKEQITSYPPKKLEQNGTTELYVTHIESTVDLYVQLVSESDTLETLMVKIEDLPRQKGMFKSIKPGMACLAEYSVDMAMYRSIVESCNEHNAVVKFVDYGNKEEKNIHELYPLPGEFAAQPPFAIHCSLAGSKFAVSQIDLDKFKDLVYDRNIKGIVKKSSDDLYELTFPDLSIGSIATENDDDDHDVISIKPMAVYVGSSVFGYISHVESLNEFYIQPCKNQPDLDQIVVKLENIGTKLSRGSGYPVGAGCCAKYSLDGCWYRAEVLEKDGSRVKVRFVDYGNTEIVEETELSSLPNDVMSFSKAAIQCKLYGDINNSAGNIEEFKALTGEQSILADFLQQDSESFNVKISVDEQELNKKFKTVDGEKFEKAIVMPTETVEVNSNENFSDLMSPAVVVEYTEKMLDIGFKGAVTVCFVVNPCEFYCNLDEDMNKLDQLMDELAEYCILSDASNQSMQSYAPGMPCAAKYSLDEGWYRAVVEERVEIDAVKVVFVDYGNSEIVAVSDIRPIKYELQEAPTFAVRCSLLNADENAGDFKERIADKSFEMRVCNKTKGNYVVDLFDNDMSLSKELFGSKVAPEKTSTQVPTISSPSLSYQLPELCLKQVENVFYLFGSSPSEFDCQLSRYQDEFSQMMDDIANEADQLNPMTAFSIDAPCIALFSGDGGWYRGKILEASSEQCRIYFVDYGNEEWVDNNNIKEIPKIFLHLPSMALKCCLSEAMPANGTWSKAEIEQFQSNCADKEFSIEIVSINSNRFSVILKDLATQEIINDAFKNSSPSDDVAVSALAYREPDLNKDSNLSCQCTVVKSVNEICCQLTELQDSLFELMENIHAYCVSSNCDVEKPVLGLPCLALYSEDNGWYRGQIIKVNEKRVTVHFVDYGNEAEVDLDNIRNVRADDVELPMACFNCKMENITVTKESIIEEICIEKYLNVHVKKIVEPCLVIGDIYLTDTGASLLQMITNKLPVEAIDDSDVISRSATVSYEEKPDQNEIDKKDLTESQDQQFTMPQLSCTQSYETYCTFVSDDARLCCKLVQYDEEFDTLMEKISEFCSEDNETLTPVTSGMPCCARFSEDDEWYRARIETNDTSNDKFKVHFVDYGNNDLVPNDRLRRIPEKHLQIPITCLEVKVIDAEYDDCRMIEIKDWLKESCLNQTFILKNISADMRNADVYFNDTMLAVKDVIKEKFKAQVEENQSPSIKDYTTPELHQGTEERVICTHVISANMIGCHLLAHDEEFDEMMGRLSQHCNQHHNELKKPIIGQPCLGRYSLDGEWYRAKVVSFSTDLVKLKYVDYGNEDEVEYANTREIVKEFTRLPSLNISCLLHDVHVEDLNEELAKKWLQDICNDVEYRITITAVHDDHVEVNLYHSSPEQTINDQLYSNFALEDQECISENTADVEERPTENDEICQKDEEKTTIEEQPEEPGLISETISKFTSPLLETAMKIQALCTCVDDDLTIHCQLSKYQHELDKLMSHIADYCADVETMPSSYEPGCACFAQFPEDSEWYRAEIIEQQEDGMIKMMFVDYGNCALVTMEQIKAIDQSFLNLPKCSVACSLQDVAVTVNDDVKTWLAGKVLDQNVEIEVKEELDNEVYRVVLFVEDENVNTLLNGHFAIPSQSELLNGTNDAESTLNHATEAVEKNEVDVGNETEAPQDVAVMNEVESKANGDIHSLEFKEPSVCVGDKELVFCTHVESWQEIYCQLSKYHTEIENLLPIITEYCERVDAVCASYDVGSVCLARFSQDQQWYRAIVKEIEDDNVKVFFVDYGNSDRISLREIRKIMPEFAVLPAACIRCQLHDVHDDDLDVKSAMKWLHDNLDQKEFELTVVEKIGDTYDCVFIRDNEAMSVNDELYSKFEIAEELVEPSESFQINGEHSNSDCAVPSKLILSRDVAVGTVSEMHLSFVKSPSSFCCQFEESADELLELMSEIASYCANDEIQTLETSPDVGTFCCAQFVEVSQWCRGEVMQVIDSKNCLIKFVDYGNTETVSVEHLKPSDDKFYSLKKQSVECSLSGIKPNTPDNTWSAMAVQEFEEMCAEQILKMEVLSKEPDKIHVIINLCDSDVTVNQIMVNKGFAVFDNPMP